MLSWDVKHIHATTVTITNTLRILSHISVDLNSNIIRKIGDTVNVRIELSGMSSHPQKIFFSRLQSRKENQQQQIYHNHHQISRFLQRLILEMLRINSNPNIANGRKHFKNKFDWHCF